MHIKWKCNWSVSNVTERSFAQSHSSFYFKWYLKSYCMLSVGSLPDMTCKINPADLENVPSGTSGKPVSYWSLSTVYCFFIFLNYCVIVQSFTSNKKNLKDFLSLFFSNSVFSLILWLSDHCRHHNFNRLWYEPGLWHTYFSGNRNILFYCSLTFFPQTYAMQVFNYKILLCRHSAARTWNVLAWLYKGVP